MTLARRWDFVVGAGRGGQYARVILLALALFLPVAANAHGPGCPYNIEACK